MALDTMQAEKLTIGRNIGRAWARRGSGRRLRGLGWLGGRSAFRGLGRLRGSPVGRSSGQLAILPLQLVELLLKATMALIEAVHARLFPFSWCLLNWGEGSNVGCQAACLFLTNLCAECRHLWCLAVEDARQEMRLAPPSLPVDVGEVWDIGHGAA